jgi:hypothetical protein
MPNFTREEVISEAHRQYGKPVSIDMIEDAMAEETLAEAVSVIVIDSEYWDS